MPKGPYEAQNIYFLSFPKIFSLFLLEGMNLKWKTLRFSIFQCEPHNWDNSASQSFIINFSGRNASALWLFAWRYSPRKGSIWDYSTWLTVFRHAQPCPNLPRPTINASGSRGMTRLTIDQCERSINSLGSKNVFPQCNTYYFKVMTKICFHPIRFQNSLIISISGRKQSVS